MAVKKTKKKVTKKIVKKATKKPTKKVAKKLDPLQIIYIIDESGSMTGNRDAVISAFNEYIEDMKKNPNPSINLSLITFEVSGNESIKYRFSKPIKEAPELTSKDYVPGGSTNLYDAIMAGINSAKPKMDTIVVIHTDGYENSSIHYNKAAVVKEIKDKTDAGWLFVYIGSGQDAWGGGADLGIQHANTIQTNNTAAGTRAAMKNLSIGSYAYGMATSEEKLSLKKSLFGNDSGLDLTSNDDD